MTKQHVCQKTHQLFVPTYLVAIPLFKNQKVARNKQLYSIQMTKMTRTFLILFIAFLELNAIVTCSTEESKKTMPILVHKDPYGQVSSLPLEEVSYSVEIEGNFARVTLVQSYTNPFNYTIDVEYFYPKAPGAIIDSLVAYYANDRIECEVLEKEEAKRAYNEEIEKGNTAAYSEIKNDDRDIVQVKLGNLPSNQKVKLEFQYIEPLSLVMNRKWEYRLYTLITERYGSSARGHETPVIVSQPAWSPESTKMRFSLKIFSSHPIEGFQSSSHNLVIREFENQSVGSEARKHVLQAWFHPDERVVPNKDIVFSYIAALARPEVILEKMLRRPWIPSKKYSKEANEQVGTGADGKDYLRKEEYSYMAQIQLTPELEMKELTKADLEYVFVVDRSGSMDGDRIQFLKAGLLDAIDLIPESSFVNIVSFGSSNHLEFLESLRATKEGKEALKSRVKEFSANLGGTETESALKLAVGIPMSQRPRVIVLMTDGDIYNTNELLNWVSTVKTARFFSVGIGNGISPVLIEGIAEKGSGSHVMVPNTHGLKEKMLELINKTLSHYISRIKVFHDFEKEIAMYPQEDQLKFVIKEEALTFFLEIPEDIIQRQMNGSIRVTLTYYSSSKPEEEQLQIIEIFPKRAVDDHKIHKMAFGKSIVSLEEDVVRFPDLKEKFSREIVELSINFQILNALTSFLCRIKDHKGEVQKSEERILVPQAESADYFEPPMMMMNAAGSAQMGAAPRMAKVKMAHQPQAFSLSAASSEENVILFEQADPVQSSHEQKGKDGAVLRVFGLWALAFLWFLLLR